MLRKPGEANNPVVETISMNDLRFNIYGGARYPAPAVVGGFGNPWRRRRRCDGRAATRFGTQAGPPRRAAAAEPANRKVEVYRGTKTEDYEVGRYGN